MLGSPEMKAQRVKRRSRNGNEISKIERVTILKEESSD